MVTRNPDHEIVHYAENIEKLILLDIFKTSHYNVYET